MLKLLVAVFCISTSAFAADAPAEAKKADPVFQEAGYQFVGLNLGLAKPTGANFPLTSPRFSYGVDYSYAVLKQLAVGVFATRDDGAFGQSTGVDFTLTRLGVEFAFSPTYESYLSLKAGVGLIEFSTSVLGVTISAKPDTNPLFIAPGAGIIFPITDRFQIIPNISYSLFFKNDDINKFQVFDAGVKGRFQF